MLDVIDDISMFLAVCAVYHEQLRVTNTVEHTNTCKQAAPIPSGRSHSRQELLPQAMKPWQKLRSSCKQTHIYPNIV